MLQIKINNINEFVSLTDAYTQKDVDYNWRGKEGIEIVSDRMAQFNLASVATYKKDSTNSKGLFQVVLCREPVKWKLI